MTADIKVEGDAIQALILKAILETWTPEQRDALVEKAISTLLNKDASDRFSTTKETVLDKAIMQGSATAATNVVHRLLTTEYVDKIEAVVREELTRMFDETDDPEQQGKLSPVRRMVADGIREALTKGRY